MRQIIPNMAHISARLLSCSLLSLLLLVPTISWAIDNDWNWNNNWDWWGVYSIQMQRESQSAADEAARQIYREKRADELEQQRKAQGKEHEVYFESVMESSKGAAGRPRNLYYRKPGFITTEAPVNAALVTVGDTTYSYDRGIFFLAAGKQYIALIAPVGAVVDTLPEGSDPIIRASSTYYYYFGTFFASTKDGKYQVIKPPAGLLVGYLPDGYQQVEVNGQTFYKFGDVYFKPFLAAGAAVFTTADVF